VPATTAVSDTAVQPPNTPLTSAPASTPPARRGRSTGSRRYRRIDGA
jgi:hypothetical protein